MTEVNVAVVILNYNGKLFLERFLPGILKNSIGCEIVVADNGSTDDSISFIKHYFPTVQIIENKDNYGFAKGYNLALNQLSAKYYVLVNSDVEVTENWIQPVIDLMEKDSNIAACQPKILDYNNRSFYEYAGASGGFIDRFGYPFCRGRIFNTLEEDKGQFDTSREIFWATGACMFVRAEAFHKVNGFDDDYFAHMEEIDLCWRLKNFGYTVYVEPKSKIYHIGGGTLNKLSKRKTFLNFRNNLTTLTKNHPSKNLLFKIIYRMILDGVAAIKFLFDGQPKHFFAVFRAHMNFYVWLPKILRERKKLKNTEGFHFTRSGIYRGNIVMDYFIRNKQKFEDLHPHFFSE